MSAPVDLHTLGVVAAALRRALDFGWYALPGDRPEDLVAARRAARTTLTWAEGLCKGEAAEEPEA